MWLCWDTARWLVECALDIWHCLGGWAVGWDNRACMYLSTMDAGACVVDAKHARRLEHALNWVTISIQCSYASRTSPESLQTIPLAHGWLWVSFVANYNGAWWRGLHLDLCKWWISVFIPSDIRLGKRTRAIAHRTPNLVKSITTYFVALCLKYCVVKVINTHCELV